MAHRGEITPQDLRRTEHTPLAEAEVRSVSRRESIGACTGTVPLNFSRMLAGPGVGRPPVAGNTSSLECEKNT
ncbi:hypothetical protein [Janibacter sp. G1551]|uniref:hypothetical protein n=1 Tax=Janibacter sp. G1551 TaxID=3420440 RepID=UPI003D015019